MKKDKKIASLDQSTEERIKQAAEKIFMEKGFSGARTRDIAEEAGINLALLNYYFRSKENLFSLVITDKLKIFFDVLINIVTDPSSTYAEKFPKIVNQYTELLLSEPNLPIFLLNELQRDPDFFATKLKVKDKINLESFAFFQKAANFNDKKDAIQVLISFLGVVIFPFIVRLPIRNIFDLSENEYNQILEERRELIPSWINIFLKNQS